jgi:hypothetical protein
LLKSACNRIHSRCSAIVLQDSRAASVSPRFTTTAQQRRRLQLSTAKTFLAARW